MSYKVVENPDLNVLRGDFGNFFPLTQSLIYGKWQEQVGRKAKFFQVIDSTQPDKPVAIFLTVTYPLAFGKNYIYIPYGPVLSQSLPHDQQSQVQILQVICGTLMKEMTESNSAFCRLDFTSTTDLGQTIKDARLRLIPSASYSLHSAYFQARKEWVLDLDKTEDELLANMHEKTRYSIRLGYRKGIESTIVDLKDPDSFDKYFSDFYRLLQDTSKRNNFGLHDRAYYEAIFKSLAQPQTTQIDLKLTYAYLSIAKYSSQILAADMIVIYDQMAYYLFGGSSHLERNRMPTHVAMWEAIKHARHSGAKVYNFGAITTGAGTNPKNPIWSGITEYKMKFGGRILEHSQLVDLVGPSLLDKLIYRLYNIRKFIKNRS